MKIIKALRYFNIKNIIQSVLINKKTNHEYNYLMNEIEELTYLVEICLYIYDQLRHEICINLNISCKEEAFENLRNYQQILSKIEIIHKRENLFYSLLEERINNTTQIKKIKILYRELGGYIADLIATTNRLERNLEAYGINPDMEYYSSDYFRELKTDYLNNTLTSIVSDL